jgi:hypothetical protein
MEVTQIIHKLIFYLTLITAKVVYRSKAGSAFEGNCGCLYWELYKHKYAV